MHAAAAGNEVASAMSLDKQRHSTTMPGSVLADFVGQFVPADSIAYLGARTPSQALSP